MKRLVEGLLFFTVLILFASVFTAPRGTFTLGVVSEEYVIYSATLPVGVYTLKGELHGEWNIIGGSVDGYIEGAEVYSIKYLDQDTLRTVIFDAEATPLKITGRFVLTEYRNETVKVSLLEVMQLLGRERSERIEVLQDKPRVFSDPWYTVEIPALPEQEDPE